MTLCGWHITSWTAFMCLVPADDASIFIKASAHSFIQVQQRRLSNGLAHMAEAIEQASPFVPRPGPEGAEQVCAHSLRLARAGAPDCRYCCGYQQLVHAAPGRHRVHKPSSIDGKSPYAYHQACRS